MKPFCVTSMIAVFLILCTNGIQAQTPQTKPNQVVIGSIETIPSKILNEQRRILVYVPASASSDIYTKQRQEIEFVTSTYIYVVTAF